MAWKVTKNVDDLKSMVTPVGVQSFDISLTTDRQDVAEYFRNYGIHSDGVPMYSVEEIEQESTTPDDSSDDESEGSESEENPEGSSEEEST